MQFKIIKADDGYFLMDAGKKEKLAEFNNYYQANIYYLNNIDNYDNLVLYQGNDVLKMEYGIVEFKTNNSCSLELHYKSLTTGSSAYLNGCLGIDAAYLYSSNDGDNVYFKIAGDVGYTNRNNVILHPYDDLDIRISAYRNFNDHLVHNIKTQLLWDFYAYSLNIDEALPVFEDNRDYFSYDGHYFYTDFVTMIDDYKAGIYEHSINYDNPYYNYYAYLSHHSMSSYDGEDLSKLFTDVYRINGPLLNYEDKDGDGANDQVNRSVYYGIIEKFFKYQYEYGANALLMLAMSMEESAFGKSLSAYHDNNLFGHMAFDSMEERNNYRYSSLEASLKAYTKYFINDRFSSFRSPIYYGSYLGNKGSGIGVEYSADPYLSEKVVQNYFTLDSALGFKDKNNYAIGIIKSKQIVFYDDEELTSPITTLNGIDDYAVILMAESDKSYKVSFDNAYSVSDDFENNYAYIAKEQVDVCLNPDKINEIEMVDIYFDDQLYKVVKGTMPLIGEPLRDGCDFVGYDQKIIVANEEKKYVSEFKKINEISVDQEFKKSYALYDELDLSSGFLKVKYEDGSFKKIPITMEMISNFNNELVGRQKITITYHGIKTEYEIEISDHMKQLNDKIKDKIASNLKSYRETGFYNKDDISYIKKNFAKSAVTFGFDDLRNFDAMLLTEYRNRAFYHLDSDLDISVSGLALSLAGEDITHDLKFFFDTYYVHQKNIDSKAEKQICKIAHAYGFQELLGFGLSFSLNYEKCNLKGPIVVSLALDKDPNMIYSVYRYDENGDIVKCRTIHDSEAIQFITDKAGDFVILKKASVNNYLLPTVVENINHNNSDPDNHGLIIEGGIILALIACGSVMIVFYYLLIKKKEGLWSDYKKSLLKAGTVHEEKLKS